MTIGLVVARYNEDISWIYPLHDRYPELNIYVYNKGNALPPDSLRKGIIYAKLKNVGNEADTYLTHMIDSKTFKIYNDDTTMFVQGNPWDHMHKDQMHRIIENGVESFEWLAFHHLPCEPLKNGCHHPELKFQEFYSDIFGKNIPDYFNFGVGGQFAVNSELIDQTPLERLYITRDLVSSKYADNWPWCFLERCWDQVIKNP